MFSCVFPELIFHHAFFSRLDGFAARPQLIRTRLEIAPLTDEVYVTRAAIFSGPLLISIQTEVVFAASKLLKASLVRGAIMVSGREVR